MKKLLLKLSASCIGISTLVGLIGIIVVTDAVMAVKVFNICLLFGLASIGLFFVGCFSDD